MERNTFLSKTILLLFLIGCFVLPLSAQQIPLPVRQLLKEDYMKGATFSLIVKEIQTGEIRYTYDSDRQVTPASVLKTVTTATALELLGEDYRFPTVLEYDGEIKEGVLHGNLYIKGSGDPTLGTAHFLSDRSAFSQEQSEFLRQWTEALTKTGIKQVKGAVIADESIFDTEGISPKWLYEDLGNYYGAGSYGLNVFDNLYHLHLVSGPVGKQPVIQKEEPEIPYLRLHNYLTNAAVSTDSAFILGAPFSPDRYLYGVIPANRSRYTLKGDIPDPALYLAELFARHLSESGIKAEGTPSCYRILKETGEWKQTEKYVITTTYSPPLKDIVRIVNERSHNLFADAILKTLGLRYEPDKGEILSSFMRGVKVVQAHWQAKGLDISSLQIYDGSGLASTDKVSAGFIGEVLTYMATQSPSSQAFMQSFPLAGSEGSVRNFLRGTSLQGNARLKSGGMSRVRSYAGYITKDGKQYAVAVFVNNYNCEGKEIIRSLEKLLTALF